MTTKPTVQIIDNFEPVSFGDALSMVTYLRSRALLRLLTQNPSDKQLLELCQAWDVTPVYFDRMRGRVLNPLGTIGALAGVILNE